MSESSITDTTNGRGSSDSPVGSLSRRGRINDTGWGAGVMVNEVNSKSFITILNK